MDKFEQLPEEKKQRIINAALEVFAKYDYKNASTDLIVAKAGISKGALFYYFKNKRALYCYLIEYFSQITMRLMLDEHFWNITDFMELLLYSAKKKAEILTQNPYLMEFSLRAFYAEHRDIAGDIQKLMENRSSYLLEHFFGNVDLSKFREGREPKELLDMLTWMADGYFHQKQMCQEKVELEDLMSHYETWAGLLRQIFYREEYL